MIGALELTLTYLKRNNIDIYIESDEKLIDEKELEFIEEAICKLPDIEREIIELA